MTKCINKLPATSKRVSLKTKMKTNNMIRVQTLFNLNTYKNKTKQEISSRIKDLDSEWDSERVLEVSSASLIVYSTFMGMLSKKCWFLLTGTVGVFLMLHALNGWCPPLPIIRKMGVRTAQEIQNEKIVLKMLRGDFSESKTKVEEMLNQVEQS